MKKRRQKLCKLLKASKCLVDINNAFEADCQLATFRFYISIIN